MQHLMRHIQACNNTTLPGGRLRFVLGEHPVGWLWPALAEPLTALGARQAADGVTLDDPAALPDLARRLAAAGYYRWRDEAFDVRSEAGAVIAQVDRGALPLLGLAAAGVHLNGLVQRPDGLHVWLGRRAADKLLDPGKLDHIVAGGVSAGLDPAQTLAKEAAEEAALPEELSRTATLQGRFSYNMERPEGLRRDVLYVYDLLLPDDFEPSPADGEVEHFELWPLAKVFEKVRDTDAFKFNVNLVLIDLFIRFGLVQGDDARLLRQALG